MEEYTEFDDPGGFDRFIRAHTALGAVPYVPEIRLHLARPGTAPPGDLAADAGPTAAGARGHQAADPPAGGNPGAATGEEADDRLYEMWERLGRLPFWAYAWAGGQALARHVLDNPELVRGRTVLDLATGSGLVAVAAAMAGAARVIANDVDPHALAAAALNARANAVAVTVRGGDLLDSTPAEDVILAGDVFYERPLARRVMPFLERAGGVVLVGDPERACSYLPRDRFQPAGRHMVPAPLENAPVTTTTIWHRV
ncbi:nicotinamide N-methylase [Planotetraspora silvatica]|uniref:Nicotinamide N-methylase n=1 Tax=Planotetraspora silvatica TaxID=234614 RepID=A0A8J3URY7_9ACTN|nr:50S ribosomal protein L11 methyltransferase [Planotetraspora silvatica]GII48406.1 nicotinamide N-methylase [Planotetraspora silvatica]